MEHPKLKITIESRKLVGHGLTTPEFVNIAHHWCNLLKQAITSVLGKNSKYNFYLTDLSHNSPALIESTFPVSLQNEGERVIEKIKEQGDKLQSDDSTGVAEDFLGRFEDMLLFPAKNNIYIKMESVLGGKTELMLDNGERTVVALQNLRLLDMECQTYAVGILEWLNIHGKANQLKIYPRVSGWKQITVTFDDALKSDVIASIGKHVKVSGLGRFRPGAFLPHTIKMENMETFLDDKDIPKLSELRGKFPNITGGRSVEEYLRNLRTEGH